MILHLFKTKIIYIKRNGVKRNNIYYCVEPVSIANVLQQAWSAGLTRLYDSIVFQQWALSRIWLCHNWFLFSFIKDSPAIKLL